MLRGITGLSLITSTELDNKVLFIGNCLDYPKNCRRLSRIISGVKTQCTKSIEKDSKPLFSHILPYKTLRLSTPTFISTIFQRLLKSMRSS